VRADELAGILERGRGTGWVLQELARAFQRVFALGLDEWFAEQVQPRLRNGSMLVRYCHDLVMLFASKDDAERVQAVLGKRLAMFGLELRPDKTRLVDFRPSVERVGVESTLPTTSVPGLSPYLEQDAHR
jgi:hypothetical protein